MEEKERADFMPPFSPSFVESTQSIEGLNRSWRRRSIDKHALLSIARWLFVGMGAVEIACLHMQDYVHHFHRVERECGDK